MQGHIVGLDKVFVVSIFQENLTKNGAKFGPEKNIYSLFSFGINFLLTKINRAAWSFHEFRKVQNYMALIFVPVAANLPKREIQIEKRNEMKNEL